MGTASARNTCAGMKPTRIWWWTKVVPNLPLYLREKLTVADLADIYTTMLQVHGPKQSICRQCGQPFTSKKFALYCSDRCRTAAHREQVKQSQQESNRC